MLEWMEYEGRNRKEKLLLKIVNNIEFFLEVSVHAEYLFFLCAVVFVTIIFIYECACTG